MIPKQNLSRRRFIAGGAALAALPLLSHSSAAVEVDFTAYPAPDTETLYVGDRKATDAHKVGRRVARLVSMAMR